MDPRHIERRVREAKVNLWMTAGMCLVAGVASIGYLPALAGLLPVSAFFGVIHYRQYRRAKRELAAFNKPPTARLLR